MGNLSRRQFVVAAAVGTGLAAAGCIEGATTTEWPMFRAGGDNRASTRESPGSDLAVGWERTVDDLFQFDGGPVTLSSATGDSETVFVSARYTLGDDPVIATAAIDVADGSTIWTSERVTIDPVGADPVPYPPTVWDDYVFAIGGREGHVLDREQGTPVFEIQLPWRPETIPGGDRALVALASGDEIAMVDLDEAEDVRWTRSTPAGDVTGVNPMTVLEDSIYITGDEGMAQLRRGDGERIWNSPLGDDGQARSTPPLVDGHNLHLRLVDPDEEETLWAIARNDRSESWQFGLGGADAIRPLLAYRAGRIYALHAGTLRSIQVGDGEVDVEGAVDVHAPYPTIGGDEVYLLGEDELEIVDRHDITSTQRIALPGAPAPWPQEAVPRSAAVIVSRRDRVLGLTAD